MGSRAYEDFSSNVPAAAVPTQVVEISLGPDGVRSYTANINNDARKDECTPLRLFYGVGLDEDLIIRDAETGEQAAVDVAKISQEYIASHSEDNGNIWFISNYYSATDYDGYATDFETKRTRGDPTVTFSPSIDNRYYIFQKPLPLYAHAYWVDGVDGQASAATLMPVDMSGSDVNWQSWGNKPNRAGNGKTMWVTSDGEDTTPGAWVGSYFIGVYESQESFQEALAGAELVEGTDNKIITDNDSNKYTIWPEKQGKPIAFLRADALTDVTSNADGGYKQGAVSFASNDWFFLLVEFYIPNDQPGIGDDGNELTDKNSQGQLLSSGADFVQYVVVRKGSEFGSGLHSENINNGDMLCWTDTSGHIGLEIEYNSRRDTGDNTRGKPSYDLLFGTQQQIEDYLKSAGLYSDESENAKKIPVKNADGSYVTDEQGQIEENWPLEAMEQYWQSVQTKLKDVLANLKAHYTAWLQTQEDKSDTETNQQKWFDETFDFTVAARTGGLRTGDMAQNVSNKSANTTDTSQTYYVPTISTSSGVGNDTIINNYLGNNGKLEIPNQELLVTKMLVPPNGLALTSDQLKKEFLYQVYIAGATGERSAIVAWWNNYANNGAGVWQRVMGVVDVLTDNSGLLLDNDGNRVLYDPEAKSLTSSSQGRVVVEVGDNYYYANEDGAPDRSAPCSKSESDLGYLYIPPNANGAGLSGSRRIYQDFDFISDTKETMPNAHRTTYVPEGVTPPADVKPNVTTGPLVNEGYATATAARPAGTRSYWVDNAEVIPVTEVKAAEGDNAIDAVAVEGESGTGGWSHEDHAGDTESHTELNHLTLLVRKPTDNSDVGGKDDIVSPYDLRSQYLAQMLTFGVNANEGDGDEPGTSIAPPFYNPFVGNTSQAANVAEFTLKSGDGLVFTGLSGQDYWFTEKLLDTDVDAGYALDNVRQITGEQEQDTATYTPDSPSQGNFSSGDYYYTVKGEVGEFEHQVHYTNTFQPGDISITKQLTAEDGTTVNEQDEQAQFGFTLSLDLEPTDPPTTGKDETGIFSYTITGQDGEKVKEGRLFPQDGPEQLPDGVGPFEEGKDIRANEEGVWAFSLTPGQTMTVTGLPTNTAYTYTITEANKDGFGVQSGVGGQLADSGTVTGRVAPEDKGTTQVTFNNIKKKPQPVQVSLGLTKTVENTGDAEFDWGDGDVFEFLVKPRAGNPAGDPVNAEADAFKNTWDADLGGFKVTVGKPTDGTLSSTAKIFDQLAYSQPGTYVYEVSEIAGTIGGIDYTEVVRTVTVEVAEDYEDGLYQGKLNATVTVDSQDAQDGVTFTNEYNPGKVAVPIRALKTLEPAPQDGFAAGTFAFRLKGVSAVYTDGQPQAAEQGQPAAEQGQQAQAPDADEAAVAPEADEAAIAGTGEDAVVDGNGDGTPAATAESEAQPAADDMPMPTPDPVIPPAGGQPDDTVVQRNDENGVVDFGKVEFTRPGTYTYQMWEQPDVVLDYFGYDDTVYTVTIVVTGAGTVESPLVASVAYSPELTPQQGVPGFANNVLTGVLQVSKTVEHQDGSENDPDELEIDWHFTVTFAEPEGHDPIDWQNAAQLEFIGGRDDADAHSVAWEGNVLSFTLRHGESAQIAGLPSGTTYEVAEDDYEGYAASHANASGTLPQEGLVEASFVNSKKTPPPPDEHLGSLSVTKTVTGTAGDTGKQWHFRVELDASVFGAFGDMEFEDGVTEFTLKHGQTATATGLPAGVTYTVTETEANQDGYDTQAEGDTGTIPDGDTANAVFVNHKDGTPPPETPPTTPGQPGSPTDDGTPPSTLPQTGDAGIAGLWIALTVLSLAAVATTAAVAHRRRRRG